MKLIPIPAPRLDPGAAPSPENRPCLQRPAGLARRRTAETWRVRTPRRGTLLHRGDGAARAMGLTQKREEFEMAYAPCG
jgi:hypothetical protein